LDFIYHNIVEVSPFTAEAIIMLAEMMRYAIDADKMGDFISLGEEIEQVSNLQNLNQVRKEEEIAFRFTYQHEVWVLNFIPLVLLTVAENIFKHGNMTQQQPASLDVSIVAERLVIRSFNQSNNPVRQERGGTGLVNIGKRLYNAYGEAAVFEYGPDAMGNFEVLITVPLTLLRGTALPSNISTDIGTI
jgi:LytS/YehU family sensor histidine kinase